MDEHITTGAAAAANGVTDRYVRQLAAAGLIPGARPEYKGTRIVWRIPHDWKHTPGTPGPKPRAAES